MICHSKNSAIGPAPPAVLISTARWSKIRVVFLAIKFDPDGYSYECSIKVLCVYVGFKAIYTLDSSSSGGAAVQG